MNKPKIFDDMNIIKRHFILNQVKCAMKGHDAKMD